MFKSETKTWFGQKVERSESSVPFRELILQSFRLNPQKIYQISDDEGTNLTFAEVEQLSIRVAQNLHRLGIRGGDVVTLILKNSTFTAPIAFGCFLLGAIVNPFVIYKGTELWWIKEVLKASKPKVIVTEDSSESIDLINQAVKEIGINPKMFVMGDTSKLQNEDVNSVSVLFMETESNKDFKISEEDGINDDSIVFIVPSSGTTGAPKLIAISGNSVKNNKFAWNYQEDVVLFSYSLISWITGIMALIFSLLNSQLRIISKEAFSPRHFGYIVKKYSVTSVVHSTQGTTAIMNSSDFNESYLASMKEFYCCGERVPKLVREFAKSKFPKGSFGVAYGMTEMGPITPSFDDADTSEIDDNTLGKPKVNVEVKVVDIESRKALGPNENGEILLRTLTMFKEYFGKPELTKNVFEGEWFKTGDFGYVDEIGRIYLHGRITHMIFVGGKNIHPAQIEQFFESFESVSEACAVTITKENLLSVLITLTPESTITEDFLLLKASEHFEEIKFEGGIFIVQEIPRSLMSKKINRIDAEKLAAELSLKSS